MRLGDEHSPGWYQRLFWHRKEWRVAHDGCRDPPSPWWPRSLWTVSPNPKQVSVGTRHYSGRCRPAWRFSDSIDLHHFILIVDLYWLLLLIVLSYILLRKLSIFDHYFLISSNCLLNCFTCSKDEDFATETIPAFGNHLHSLIEMRLQVLQLEIGHQMRILVAHLQIVFQLKCHSISSSGCTREKQGQVRVIYRSGGSMDIVLASSQETK